ncbi:OmpA family protein [Paraburkholderia bryophila]|nr:OmpA family protein [Paraburkholderia bryophila]WCM24844.1 OmpA family protein [Paraburkholderia bryophila]
MTRLIIPAVVLGGLLLAACSSASGPMFSAYSVDTGDGVKAYRVECRGVFEGAQTCMKQAEHICGDKPVHVLSKVDQLRAADDTRADPRVLNFKCEAPAAEAATPAPAVVPVVPVVPKSLQLAGDTTFDVDGSTLSTMATARLDALLSQSGGAVFKTVNITGYTDSTGSLKHNLALSGARAHAVTQYLKDHGLHADNYVVRGAGPANPVASNATPSGRAQNRRVEIRLDTE